MKHALILGCLLLSLPAAAQTTYRCQSSIGQFTFQDRPCPRVADADAPRTPRSSTGFDAQPTGGSDWSQQQRRYLQQRARAESAASALRVKSHLKSQTDRQAAGHATSQRNCVDALQIARLCGKFAGQFSCDDRGFVRESLADRRLRGSTASDGLGAHDIDRCALQAASGNLKPSNALAAPAFWQFN